MFDPKPFPRTLVPAAWQLNTWADLEPLYTNLEKLPVDTQAAVDIFLKTWDEIERYTGEAFERAYVQTTLNTADQAATTRFEYLINRVQPKIETAVQKIRARLLASPAFQNHPEHPVLRRHLTIDQELFSEANIPLQVKDQLLGQEYMKISGHWTIEMEGKQITFPQAAAYLQDRDRTRREEAWKKLKTRRLEDADTLDELYSRMLANRRQLAVNLNLPSPITYYFKTKKRDYTPEQCLEFCRSIETAVMPLVAELHQNRRKKLGLNVLEPWDLAVDEDNAEPLRPFNRAAEMVEKTRHIFQDLDPELAAYFSLLNDRNQLDLDSRMGKAPGGYQAYFPESQLPFIFMNASGLHRDVETILHEAGHAFHAFLAAEAQSLNFYRHSGMEFAEVASMSMELLTIPYLHRFYTPEQYRRACRRQLQSIIEFFPRLAKIVAFQHAVYAKNDRIPSPEERRRIHAGLCRRFNSPIVNADTLIPYNPTEWHEVLHIFELPFYYMEYGIAQLGALQVWEQSLKNPGEALQRYKKALRLGGSRTVPELFAAAGLSFDFSESALTRLMDLIRDQLTKL